MDVVVTIGAMTCQIVITNKLTLSFLQARCPSCHLTNSVKELKRKKYHIPQTCSSQAHPGSSNLVSDQQRHLVTLRKGCQAHRQPFDTSTPFRHIIT